MIVAADEFEVDQPGDPDRHRRRIPLLTTAAFEIGDVTSLWQISSSQAGALHLLSVDDMPVLDRRCPQHSRVGVRWRGRGELVDLRPFTLTAELPFAQAN